MQSDLEVVLNELTELKKQAEGGRIDSWRWLDFITYLNKLGCITLAESVSTSLKIYEDLYQRLRLFNPQSPAMARRSE